MSPLPAESFPEWLAQIRDKCSKQMGPECEPQRWEDPLGKPWKEEAKEHLVLPTGAGVGPTGNTLSGPQGIPPPKGPGMCGGRTLSTEDGG